MSEQSEKLIVVSFFEDLEPGYRFAAGEWPPHLTLIRPFRAEPDSVPDIETALAGLLERQPAIGIEFGETARFGPQADVPVTTVVPNPELQALHDRLLELLAAYDVEPNSRWSGDEYRPHVSRQRRGQPNPGETAELRSATLLDYQDDPPTRTVRRPYPF